MTEQYDLTTQEGLKLAQILLGVTKIVSNLNYIKNTFSINAKGYT